MDITLIIVGVVVGAVVGAVAAFMAARSRAKAIVAQAEADGEMIKKEKMLQAKEKFIQLKERFLHKTNLMQEYYQNLLKSLTLQDRHFQAHQDLPFQQLHP